MSIIIKNIDCLVTCEGSYKKTGKDMKDAKILNDGFIVIENNLIKFVGTGEGYKEFIKDNTKIIDGTGKTITPGLVDPHTHVVYS